ncbi:MAG: p [Rhodospirillales bacterium]|nr:p [Rhodospirillales bacterium]
MTRLGLPFRHPAVFLGTWFGAGLLPGMPGTWGSLAALPFAWLIAANFGGVSLVIAAAVVFAVGCWAAGVICRGPAGQDPGAIVIDEVAAQFLVLAVTPPGLLTYAAGFIFFRLADILKPWPVNWIDHSVHGGLGVMLDDVFAAVYAGLALLLLMRVGLV